MTDVAVIAVFVLLYGTVSTRVTRVGLTPTIVFVAFGIVAGSSGLDWIELDLEEEGVRLLAEATLILVLFTDAARIDLRALRRQYQLPARLLGIGLPLTIAAGGLVALVVLDQLEFWEAFLVGAILAPTDAALGQIVVTSPRLPVRVRQTLNVESGLNDGIALPVITIFLALAAVEEDIESTSFWVEFIAKQIGFGVLVGVVGGAVGMRLIDIASRREWITGVSRQLSTLAVAVGAYAVASTIDGNGFIAAFTAGIAAGGVARHHCEDVFNFTEDEGELLTLLTFLIFGAAFAGPALDELSWEIAVYAVASLTAVRMVPVAIGLLGTGLRPATVGFLGWFGPRGLASIVFGLLILEEADLAGGDFAFLVVTWTVLLSVVAHGLTAMPLTNRYADSHQEMAGEDADMAESEEMIEARTRLPHRD